MKKYAKIACNLIYSIALLLIIIFLLPKLLAYFMPFVIGFLFSLLANPIVKFLEKRIKIKRKYGSAIMIILAIGIVALICYGAVSLLLVGIQSFMGQLPTMYESAEAEIKNALSSLQNIINSIPFIDNVDLSWFDDQLSNTISSLLDNIDGNSTISAISNMARSLPDTVINVIIGLLAAYFFTSDKEKLTNFLKSILPESFQNHMLFLYQQSIGAMVGYFKAQFKIMGIIYIVLTIGLLFLKIRYAWLIGLGIAFLDMLPVFGTGTVLGPWAIIKILSGNYSVAIGMIILYLVTFLIHQLLQPKLVGDSMGINPFAALFFMYIGYRISGVFGMIISIPIGMIIINMAKAGAFNNQLWCIKELINDFNNFRKIDGRFNDTHMKR